MNFDIEKVIEKMRNDEFPLFVSERHLQVEFILKAKEIYKDYKFIPEYVFEGEKVCHIDLVISDGDEQIAFEFKYVTAGRTISVAGKKEYKLKNHAAFDIRRYECVKDISRLEEYVNSEEMNCKSGYLLLISNAKGFWEGSRNDVNDEEFHIDDGITLKKGLHSGKKGAKTFRDKQVKLKNDYKIKYKDYKNDDNGKNGKFKYLVVKVERSPI